MPLGMELGLSPGDFVLDGDPAHPLNFRRPMFIIVMVISLEHCTPLLVCSRSSSIFNIAILDLSKAISRKRCKIGGKLVLITNRKSYVSFRLVPKSVTLNDLERRNGCYFALFHRTRVRCCPKTITSVSKSTFNSI